MDELNEAPQIELPIALIDALFDGTIDTIETLEVALDTAAGEVRAGAAHAYLIIKIVGEQ